jgi:putative phosphoesterase
MIIGLISDTHGQLYEEAFNALKGVDAIVHAGDVGGLEILKALNTIAPVNAVRGNMDGGPWASSLPLADMITFEEYSFYVLHDLYRLDLDPPAAGIHVVVSGHTHRSSIETINGVLYFNPGSASQRRHGRPLSVGRIQIAENGPTPEIIHLDG